MGHYPMKDLVRVINCLLVILPFLALGSIANAEYLPLAEDIVLGEQVQVFEGQLASVDAYGKYWDSLYDPDPEVRADSSRGFLLTTLEIPQIRDSSVTYTRNPTAVSSIASSTIHFIAI